MSSAPRSLRLAVSSAADALSVRAPGSAGHAAESAASYELMEALVRDPCTALQRCVEFALPLCRANVVGLCLLKVNALGRRALQWEARIGDWDALEDGDASWALASCTASLQAGVALLGVPAHFDSNERTWSVRIAEVLLIPLRQGAARPLGALFIGRFDPCAPFCRNDLRVAEWLSGCAQLALKLDVASSGSPASASDLVAADECFAEERRKRRHAEAANRTLEQVLASKDALIREAHHRVKNTLQIAASLLSLKDRITDESARQVLRQARDQIHVLANVHDLLAHCDDAQSGVHMPRLIELICSALRQSFPDSAERVLLQASCDDIELPADTAILVTLAANELITNAYKHAFPPPLSGEISVDLQWTRGNETLLRVRDTGVGIKAHDHTDGLGLVLVRAFANQLRSELSIISTPGKKGVVTELRVPRPARLQKVASA